MKRKHAAQEPLPQDEFQVELKSGFRIIRPYFSYLETFCKARWLRRPILEVFAKEFRDQPASYYRKAITDGRYLVIMRNPIHTRVQCTLR